MKAVTLTKGATKETLFRVFRSRRFGIAVGFGLIFLKFNTIGDGILTALKICEAANEMKKSVSKLNSLMKSYPQVLVNAKVKNENKKKYFENDEIKEAIKVLETKFKDDGRVLIRPSGTEPLVRVMIEGKDIEVIRKEAEKLAQLIERRLN